MSKGKDLINSIKYGLYRMLTQYSFLRLLVPMKYNSLVWKTVSAFIRRFKTLGFLLTKTNVEQRHAQQYLPYSRTVEPHFTCIHFMQTV